MLLLFLLRLQFLNIGLWYIEKGELKKELASLKDKEEELTSDVNKLQDSDYIARYAREKYYYSKDGELILKIPLDDEEESDSK